MLDINKKRSDLDVLAEYRRGLLKKPELRNLFLELTLRCNERCIHCGSSCGDVTSEELAVSEYDKLLREVKEDFGTGHKMLCITGGEPLLRKEFFEIMEIAHRLGFSWGMTSNGTLITKDVAKDLKRVGMRTISVSIDGLEQTHDSFRRTPGGYAKAMQGIENLLEVGGWSAVQVTTVVTHLNISQLDELFSIFDKMDLDSWRVINIEPIGRAKDHPELLLTPEDYRRMFEFIRQKRMEGQPVCYGCSHYLGEEFEREVRDWYYLCTAGLYTASIMANGDITACLDIERRPEFIQGNIRKDRFSKVWNEGFKEFRRDLSDTTEQCRGCPEAKYCHGDAFHSYNFDEHRPEVCFKNVLFGE
ncbi:MAG: radical SAM protein [Ruminococcus sp.]|nr:radical SAM protein [Ruminococcus sp.]